jgi:hypothetical protein
LGDAEGVDEGSGEGFEEAHKTMVRRCAGGSCILGGQAASNGFRLVAVGGLLAAAVG